MRNWRRVRPAGAVALIVLLLLLMVRQTAGPRPSASWVEKAVSEAVYPLQVVTDWVAASLRGVGTGVVELFHLRVDNAQLRAEAQQIPDLLTRVRELQRENAQLRHQLGLAAEPPQPLLAARIVGRYMDSWLRTITIGRGSLDGVQPDMAVRNVEGLVGKVLRVTPHTAVVQLLIEPVKSTELGMSAGIGAMDQTSRQAGIVTGRGNDPLRLVFFNCDLCASPGDPVITSGLGSLIPQGIYIGKVDHVAIEENGLAHVAYVMPAVDFSHLEWVFVVQTPKGAP